MTIQAIPAEPHGVSSPEVMTRPGIERSVLTDQFGDRFFHWSGRPTHPGSALMIRAAWETHAAGYLRTGLAKQAAITEDGLLNEHIDKSRERDDITYHLAINPANLADRSTARVIAADSIEELPTYPLTASGINKAGRRKLNALRREGFTIDEVGALANSLPGYSAGASEILRNVVRDSVGRGKRLFCSMVVEARSGLIPSLSERVLEPIGAPVVLEENEFRKETTLIPLLINPDQLVTNIFRASQEAPKSAARHRYLRSAQFFAAKVPTEFIPPELLEISSRVGNTSLSALID